MSVLFEPVAIGGLHLKNRFVRSATNDYLGRPDGAISAQQMELYRDLSAGGIGLIITGHAYVQHPLGRASVNQNAIYDDRFIEGYRGLVDVVHTAGAALVLDAAAVELQPGGTATERTHQVIHVLDPQGVERHGEVSLPAGADVLTLRTLKKDGRTLEPERAGGGDKIRTGNSAEFRTDQDAGADATVERGEGDGGDGPHERGPAHGRAQGDAYADELGRHVDGHPGRRRQFRRNL